MENNVGMWKQEIMMMEIENEVFDSSEIDLDYEFMMMEIENEVFDSSEIDLDYEFDAPRFFDFTAQQQQSLTQLPQPERWFETAGTYPPSRSFSFNFSSLSLFSK
ncbi:hypothetical protein MTR_2g038240 [Medicago truncatula]|uniref:Uncharacterized protein n=1 Tax=Medicago truncatula TaxID=3880 RepID=Q2HVI2_MEDTR|nr:hypothetical protein MtrDRAFT_AC148819g2v2 [Medicago truncatula]AES65349.1 hypothetical protein MTR_2g038240 [Medicago truncatula]